LLNTNKYFSDIFKNGSTNQAIVDLCFASTKALESMSDMSERELKDLENQLAVLLDFNVNASLGKDASNPVTPVPAFDDPAPARRSVHSSRSLRRKFQASRSHLDGEVWCLDSTTFSLFTSAMPPAARFAALAPPITQRVLESCGLVAIFKVALNIDITGLSVPIVFFSSLLFFFFKLRWHNRKAALSSQMICIYCVSDDFCSLNEKGYTTVDEVSDYYASMHGICVSVRRRQIDPCGKRLHDGNCEFYQLSEKMQDDGVTPCHKKMIEQVLVRLRDTHHLFLQQDELDPTEFDPDTHFVRNEKAWLT